MSEPYAGHLSDEELERYRVPRGLLAQQAKDSTRAEVEAKGLKIAAIREDEKPLSLDELMAARNKAMHQMIRRFNEMKPAEVISAIGVLDGEIAAQKVLKGPETASAEPSRDEMLKALGVAKA